MYFPSGSSLGIRNPPTRTRFSFLQSTPALDASCRTSRFLPSTTSTRTRFGGPPSRSLSWS